LFDLINVDYGSVLSMSCWLVQPTRPQSRTASLVHPTSPAQARSRTLGSGPVAERRQYETRMSYAVQLYLLKETMAFNPARCIGPVFSNK
jgi:hypothetical protein